jgi:DNA-binding beta-propeller fold protein YncE
VGVHVVIYPIYDPAHASAGNILALSMSTTVFRVAMRQKINAHLHGRLRTKERPRVACLNPRNREFAMHSTDATCMNSIEMAGSARVSSSDSSQGAQSVRRFPVAILLFVLLSMTVTPGLAFARSLNYLFPEPVYVDLQKTGDIEVFPQQKVWHGFPECHYVEVGPKGNLLIVSGFKTGQVYFADAHTGKELAILKIGKLVQGVNISPTGRVAVAVDASGGAVDVINLSSFEVTHIIPVGKIPHNVVFSPHGHYAYVSVQGADKIAVIDMHTDRLIRDIPIPGFRYPHNMALSPNGEELWVRNHPKPNQDGHVAVINLITGKVERDIRVGLYHGGMDDLPSGRLAFTTDIGSDTVDVLSPKNLHMVKKIDVGAGPHGVRSGNGGKWVYAATSGGNQLVIINVHTLKVVRRIPLKGKFGFWLAVKGRP